jgi:hypothetical protein
VEIATHPAPPAAVAVLKHGDVGEALNWDRFAERMLKLCAK